MLPGQTLRVLVCPDCGSCSPAPSLHRSRPSEHLNTVRSQTQNTASLRASPCQEHRVTVSTNTRPVSQTCADRKEPADVRRFETCPVGAAGAARGHRNKGTAASPSQTTAAHLSFVFHVSNSFCFFLTQGWPNTTGRGVAHGQETVVSRVPVTREEEKTSHSHKTLFGDVFT